MESLQFLSLEITVNFLKVKNKNFYAVKNGFGQRYSSQLKPAYLKATIFQETLAWSLLPHWTAFIIHGRLHPPAVNFFCILTLFPYRSCLLFLLKCLAIILKCYVYLN